MEPIFGDKKTQGNRFSAGNDTLALRSDDYCLQVDVFSNLKSVIRVVCRCALRLDGGHGVLALRLPQDTAAKDEGTERDE
jgi:hypothetical protein